MGCGRKCSRILIEWEKVVQHDTEASPHMSRVPAHEASHTTRWYADTHSMLLGEYTHTLDDKRRVMLPKKFKDALGKKVVVTRGLDNCLFLYSHKEWADVAKRLRELSFAQKDTRGFNRFMFSGAAEVDVDRTGRILIPEHLKQFAALKTKVVLAGVSDRVEIWDEKRWVAYQEQIERQGDALAEKLGEIGVL